MNFKKSLSLVALTTIFASASMAANKDKQAPATLEVDPAATVVKWEGKKVTGAHNGKVPLKSGTVELKGDALVGGKFEINLAGMTVDDITDAETNKKFVGHMTSDDFFATEKFPTATFVIKKVAAAKPAKGKDTTHNITGDLTIKDQTHSVTFPAKVVSQEGKVSADADIVVDRTKFGLKYGSGKFFKGLGDKAINDKFTLNVSLKTKG